ncbi:hypothetical protein SNOG_06056 [Parastagonospora nodorum SN15]|uniref:Uncharacterized protein n=1 Tax=Phaeosphaeria nodorum (strain SN15 / ATCC MYA-4574 / FGSC 10173) TaxID=321614 RepID=Q0UQA8_PHANO|nr:hypothetical protein SNOG_06056 [Parastagonospora nodorum SN15]EAT87120.1 hypothetical protein SNOG_06056 [Parastagonospora nodorum SN15]
MHYQKPGMTPTVVAGIRDSIELWRPIYDQKKDVKPEQKKDITLRYGGGWAMIGWIKMGLWPFATTEKNVLPEW